MLRLKATLAVEEKNHLSPVTCHSLNQTKKILSINSTKYLFSFVAVQRRAQRISTFQDW